MEYVYVKDSDGYVFKKLESELSYLFYKWQSNKKTRRYNLYN